MFKPYDHGAEKAPRAPLARLDKEGHINSYSILMLRKGERGDFTEFPIHPNRSVGYQTQGPHHFLDGMDVFAAVQPYSTDDSF